MGQYRQCQRHQPLSGTHAGTLLLQADGPQKRVLRYNILFEQITNPCPGTPRGNADQTPNAQRAGPVQGPARGSAEDF